MGQHSSAGRRVVRSFLAVAVLSGAKAWEHQDVESHPKEAMATIAVGDGDGPILAAPGIDFGTFAAVDGMGAQLQCTVVSLEDVLADKCGEVLDSSCEAGCLMLALDAQRRLGSNAPLCVMMMAPPRRSECRPWETALQISMNKYAATILVEPDMKGWSWADPLLLGPSATEEDFRKAQLIDRPVLMVNQTAAKRLGLGRGSRLGAAVTITAAAAHKGSQVHVDLATTGNFDCSTHSLACSKAKEVTQAVSAQMEPLLNPESPSYSPNVSVAVGFVSADYACHSAADASFCPSQCITVRLPFCDSPQTPEQKQACDTGTSYGTGPGRRITFGLCNVDPDGDAGYRGEEVAMMNVRFLCLQHEAQRRGKLFAFLRHLHLFADACNQTTGQYHWQCFVELWRNVTAERHPASGFAPLTKEQLRSSAWADIISGAEACWKDPAVWVPHHIKAMNAMMPWTHGRVPAVQVNQVPVVGGDIHSGLPLYVCSSFADDSRIPQLCRPAAGALFATGANPQQAVVAVAATVSTVLVVAFLLGLVVVMRRLRSNAREIEALRACLLDDVHNELSREPAPATKQGWKASEMSVGASILSGTSDANSDASAEHAESGALV